MKIDTVIMTWIYVMLMYILTLMGYEDFMLEGSG